MALLEVDDLRTYFHTREGVVRAVEGVSFSVEKGETLGIVGESGSGKSVANYSLLGLVPCPPGRIESGTARFGGIDLLRCSAEERRAVRGRRISMVFQDPMTALNPYMTIGEQVMEPLLVHEGSTRGQARERAAATMDSVGIPDASKRLSDYPHQYSGGMRQRVMIAMALITKPEILIADEPTTALDVTVQAQILALIKKRQQDLGMAVILVTHDFGIVAGVCDRVLVMYAGRIVESAATRELFRNPRHPYTKALMASMPSAHAKGEELYTIPGMPPDLARPMTGCPFAPRCEHAVDMCRRGATALVEIAPGRASACLRVQAGEL
ncbi:MAG: ABC transporter ATP-binding protein [Candidatus Hydrogenedentes bacterium]|nr:ABC transporter ATP-binding protein [Candidatus Hydrogenedentota bacterium]